MIKPYLLLSTLFLSFFVLFSACRHSRPDAPAVKETALSSPVTTVNETAAVTTTAETTPITTVPTTTEAITAPPATTVTETTKPQTTAPVTTTPVTTAPTTTKPVTTEPITTAPTTTRPVTTEPITTAPVTTEPTKTPSVTTEVPVVFPLGATVLDGVPYICQKPAYPNGCESVSTVMALQYLGVDITVDTFIDQYLDRGSTPKIGGKGPDPSLLYGGDPRSANGWGCYSPVIVKALMKFLDPAAFTIWSSDTMSLHELCQTYIDRGYPVVVWGLLNMKPLTGPWVYTSWTSYEGKTITYHLNSHCLLLVGYDDTSYYFHDPMTRAYIAYQKGWCEQSFSLLGQQSIAIVPSSAPILPEGPSEEEPSFTTEEITSDLPLPSDEAITTEAPFTSNEETTTEAPFTSDEETTIETPSVTTETTTPAPDVTTNDPTESLPTSESEMPVTTEDPPSTTEPSVLPPAVSQPIPDMPHVTASSPVTPSATT